MGKEFIIETSARHIHVSEKDFKILFGEDAVLTKKKDLSQPGQYACEERVAVIGPKGQFPAVSILGPVRNATQVEISASDALPYVRHLRRQLVHFLLRRVETLHPCPYEDRHGNGYGLMHGE